MKIEITEENRKNYAAVYVRMNHYNDIYLKFLGYERLKDMDLLIEALEECDEKRELNHDAGYQYVSFEYNAEVILPLPGTVIDDEEPAGSVIWVSEAEEENLGEICGVYPSDRFYFPRPEYEKEFFQPDENGNEPLVPSINRALKWFYKKFPYGKDKETGRIVQFAEVFRFAKYYERIAYGVEY